MTAADLDHTSFAVRDAAAWARTLRAELGATPIAGEALPEFRYLLLHLGTADAGGRLELIEPAARGFLAEFLDRRGEGPHHITFTVPDLQATVAHVRDLGLIVTGEDYGHQSWQEAFIVPDATHRVVIQLAQSDAAYPPPAELVAGPERDTATFPSSRGATDPTWWTPLWDTPAGPAATLAITHLRSTDLDLSHQLFAQTLGGQASVHNGQTLFTWPGGTLLVEQHERPGIHGVTLRGAAQGDLTIGATGLVVTPDDDAATDCVPPTIRPAT